MNEEKMLPMGKIYKGNFGHFEFPTEIFQVGIYENKIEILCEDGIWNLIMDDNGKVFVKKINDSKIKQL